MRVTTANEGDSGADSAAKAATTFAIATTMATTPAPSNAATDVNVETFFSCYDLQGASSVTGGVL